MQVVGIRYTPVVNVSVLFHECGFLSHFQLCAHAVAIEAPRLTSVGLVCLQAAARATSQDQQGPNSQLLAALFGCPEASVAAAEARVGGNLRSSGGAPVSPLVCLKVYLHRLGQSGSLVRQLHSRGMGAAAAFLCDAYPRGVSRCCLSGRNQVPKCTLCGSGGIMLIRATHSTSMLMILLLGSIP